MKKIIVMVSVCMVAGLSGAALVNRYTFDTSVGANQVVDTVGTLNASWRTQAAVVTDAAPQYRKQGNGSVYFNGNGSTVQFDNWDAGNTFTMTWWVYRQSSVDVDGDEYAMPLLANTTYSDRNGILFYANNHWVAGNVAEGRLSLLTGSSASATSTTYVDNVVPVKDAFYHVALSINGTSKMGSTYVNGILVDVSALDSTFTMEDKLWRLGSQAGGPGVGSFKGFLDDIQIYDTELTGADINTLATNPGTVIPEPATLSMIFLSSAALFSLRRLYM